MGEITNRKRVIGVVVAVAVLVVVAFFVIVFLTAPPPSPLFTVTGKVQPTESVGGYEVMSWNFTFAYRGTNALQNVNIYLNN